MAQPFRRSVLRREWKRVACALATAWAGLAPASPAPAAPPAQVASVAPAGDWPQWRGPRRDDVSGETGLLKEWPAEGPPLAWKATGVGLGFSSVSVAGGKIFTLGDLPDGTYLLALDANGGKKLWGARIGPPSRPGDEGSHFGPRCTPTVDGELVFALSQKGDLICAETATGKEVWRKSLPKDFAGAMMSEWGFAESPLVDGDKVICTPGSEKSGTLLALNKKTGEPVWQTAGVKDPASYSSAVAVEIAGVRQAVQLTGSRVFGAALADGKVLWSAPRKGGVAVVATPVVHDDCVFVTSSYGAGCNLFRVTADGGTFAAAQVYANKDMSNHHGGVVLVGENLYGSGDPGALKCIDFKTGKVLWKDRTPGKGSLTYADGHLYVRSESGNGAVYLIEATPEGYKDKGHFNQPNRSDKNSWPHPVVAGGKLYLRDQDLLLCYDVKLKEH